MLGTEGTFVSAKGGSIWSEQAVLGSLVHRRIGLQQRAYMNEYSGITAATSAAHAAQINRYVEVRKQTTVVREEQMAAQTCYRNFAKMAQVGSCSQVICGVDGTTRPHVM